MSEDGTTIWVSKKTKDRLDALGKFGESYDDLINRLISRLSEVDHAHV